MDRLVDTLGNVPPELIQQSFRMLKPASEVSPVRYVSLWQNVLNDQYVEQFRAFDRWTSDHIPFAGEAFRQTVKELMWENKLVEGTLVLGGQPVQLEQHHGVVPRGGGGAGPHRAAGLDAACSRTWWAATDKELVVMPGGHVGLAAGRKAVQTLWPKVAAWLSERSQAAAWSSAMTSAQ